MSDDPLHRFAEKVVELRGRKEQKLDEDLMREVARELGMTDEELASAKAQSDAHKQRAQALRSAGSLDEAVSELETAWAFNPLDVELMYLLADALFARSQRKRDVGDWQRARDMCTEVLATAPAHREAPALLNAIRNNDPEKKPSRAGSLASVVVVAACVLALVGVGAALLILL